MRVPGHPYALLSDQEVDCIHHGAMRILAEVGMQIQNDSLLSVLADFGLPVDFSTQRVRFPTPLVERFLADAEKHDWEHALPRVSGSAGVYHSRFHHPQTLELIAWSEETLAFYFALARGLSVVNGAVMLGCRLPVPPALEPLYERYYCWKHGANEGSSIYLDELCPYLYDLYAARAAEQNKSIEQVFRGTVYLLPALKLGRHEAYQVDFFRKRGLRVGIGDMFAMGASAPVTLAGAVTLNIAEQFALRILDWAWFAEKRLHIGGSLSVLDMRTMIFPFGRPEMAIANLMTAQMARLYGASYSGHAGLTDAKLPTPEAGYQKAMTALPTLLACGSFWMDAGLLANDEVVSPVQLILDNEFLSALQHMTRDFEVSEETIGLETIFQAGPGGLYLDKDHTARHFRGEHWQPSIWAREMLGPWLSGRRMLDVDKAREIALEAYRGFKMGAQIRPEFEKEILSIIKRAGEELGV